MKWPLPPRLMLLKTWSPACDTVWEDHGSLLPEALQGVGHWGRALRFWSLTSFPVHDLLLDCDVIVQLPPPQDAPSPSTMGCVPVRQTRINHTSLRLFLVRHLPSAMRKDSTQDLVRLRWFPGGMG